METKTCNKCGKDKPIDQYYLNRSRPMSSCKACHFLVTKATKARNPEKWREKQRAYRDKIKALSLSNSMTWSTKPWFPAVEQAAIAGLTAALNTLASNTNSSLFGTWTPIVSELAKLAVNELKTFTSQETS